MKGTRLTMTKSSNAGSQGLSQYFPYLQQNPPSTQLTSPQPSTQSNPSLPDVLEACLSEKDSAGAEPSMKCPN